MQCQKCCNRAKSGTRVRAFTARALNMTLRRKMNLYDVTYYASCKQNVTTKMSLSNTLSLLFGELESWVVITLGFVHILIVSLIVLHRDKLTENAKPTPQIVVTPPSTDPSINENIVKVKENSLYLMLYSVKGFSKGAEEYFLETLLAKLEKYIFHDGRKSGCLELIRNWINCNKNNMNNLREHRTSKN